MTSTLSITGADLIRALRGAMPAIDDAVRQRAKELAGELAADGVATRVLRRGAGAYTVEVVADGLFAQEFGSQAADAAPAIGTAVARVRRP